jgi:DNA-binding Lrp family transcriptional regulator
MSTAIDEDSEDTSKQAFNSVRAKINKMHLQCIEAMTKMGRATANEVAAAVSENFTRRTTLRRRVQELEGLGRAKRSGLKVCDISGERVIAYELVNS